MDKTKKILSIVLIVAFLVTLLATRANAITLYTEGAYTFADIDDDYVALYGFDNSSDTLIVPEKFKNRYVRSVYDYAFEDNTSIKSIDFSQCSNLFYSIGVRAFSGCTALTGNLIIPKSVKTLGISAFEKSGVTSVEMNCRTQGVPIQLFNRCPNLEEVYLPINCESIDNLAFANCPKLKDVYFPSSVIRISDSAFLNSGDFTVHCFSGSYAESFAIAKGYDYDILNPIYGDVEGNGFVDVMDVTYLQKYKARFDGYTMDVHAVKRADVNKDDKVNIRDATLIQMYIAKVISEF